MPTSDEAPQGAGEVSLHQPRRLGRYVLCTELAAGGMGRVFLGRAEGARGFDKLVAIKVIHGHYARKQAFVEMFLDEARISSRVVHPNVCSVFDFGEENGVLYLVMEYLAGRPAASIASALWERPDLRESPLHFPLLAHVVAQACEGLHAVHTLRGDDGEPMRIVHRDVSPENLFVTYDGAAQVMDFGVAHASGRLHESKQGELKGKVAYAAPEQLDGMPATPQADVWSTGVVLWELLTHRHLFWRETEAATLTAVIRDEIPAPSSVVPDVPATLDRAVMRALERDPRDRYESARAMAAALNELVASRRVHVGMAEVGDWMRHLFPERHAETRRLEQRARQMDAHRAAEALPVHSEMVSEAPPAYSGVRLSGDAADGAPLPQMTAPGDPPPTPEGGPGDRRRALALAFKVLFVAATVGGGALGAYVLTSGETAETPAPPVDSEGATRSDEGDADETRAATGENGAQEPRATADETRAETGENGAEADETTTEETPGSEGRPASRDEASAAAGDGQAAPARTVRETSTAQRDGAGATGDRGSRERAGRKPAAKAEPGAVSIFVSGGYAEVYEGDKNLGGTPGRFELSAGRHVLTLRPAGDAEPIQKVVRIRPGGNTTLSLALE